MALGKVFCHRGRKVLMLFLSSYGLGSRWRWWWHFKEVWKLVHHWVPQRFVPHDNHTSLISVIDLMLLPHLFLFIHRNSNSVFASAKSSWPEQTCKGWVLSCFHFNFTMFWAYRWREFLLWRGLCFLNFVLLNIVLRSTSEQSRKKIFFPQTHSV